MGTFSGELLARIFDSVDFPVVSVTPDGTILFVNSAAAKNLSTTQDAAIGRSLYEYFPASTIPLRERLRQTVTARTAQAFEAVVELPDGSERRYESTYYPTLDGLGEVTAVQIVSRDVTADHVRAGRGGSDLWEVVSDGLSLTNQRVQAILANAPIVISVYDPDMKIRYMNRLLQGRRMDDVIGQTPLSWITEAHRPILTAAFDRVLRTKEVAECQVQGVSQKYWLVRLAPLVHDGEVRQVLGCTLDVTEQIQLQSRLATRRRVESLGAMARGIAHDFNNLLTAITNSVVMARAVDDVADATPHFETIDAAARRAADLCRQMLLYARGSATPPEPVALNDVIRDVAAVTRAAGALEIELDYMLQDDLPPVACNRAQLGQVVLNLVNNAADAIGAGPGRIRVETDLVDFAGGPGDYLPLRPAPGRYVRLRVVDDGSGFEAETHGQIFDPYYSSKVDGHGLGLSVVLGIVATFGGAIAVDSASNRGTTMTVLLPPFLGPDAGVGTDDGTNVPESILVVDDDAMVRRTLIALLARAGHDVIEAEDGDAAISMLASRRAPTKLVILDVTMPNRDGYSTLAELRKTRPALPVLLSSGCPVDLPGDDPWVDYLAKPYTSESLQKAIDQLLAGASAQR